MLFISRCSRCPREQRAERTDANFLEIELKYESFTKIFLREFESVYENDKFEIF